MLIFVFIPLVLFMTAPYAYIIPFIFIYLAFIEKLIYRFRSKLLRGILIFSRLRTILPRVALYFRTLQLIKIIYISLVRRRHAIIRAIRNKYRARAPFEHFVQFYLPHVYGTTFKPRTTC